MASYKDIDWAGDMPHCQHHEIDRGAQRCLKPGIFDAPTTSGPWANLCEEHEPHHAQQASKAGFRRVAI